MKQNFIYVRDHRVWWNRLWKMVLTFRQRWPCSSTSLGSYRGQVKYNPTRIALSCQCTSCATIRGIRTSMEYRTMGGSFSVLVALCHLHRWFCNEKKRLIELQWMKKQRVFSIPAGLAWWTNAGQEDLLVATAWCLNAQCITIEHFDDDTSEILLLAGERLSIGLVVLPQTQLLLLSLPFSNAQLVGACNPIDNTWINYLEAPIINNAWRI